MNECVLCDWVFDPLGAPIVVRLTEGVGTPLRWPADELAPRECTWADGIAETILEVALVSHWAQVHPALLTGALGHDRWKLSPM